MQATVLNDTNSRPLWLNYWSATNNVDQSDGQYGASTRLPPVSGVLSMRARRLRTKPNSSSASCTPTA